MVFLPAATAQTEHHQQVEKLLKDIHHATEDSTKADLLYRLANYYYQNRAKVKDNALDSALLFATQAAELSKRAGYQERYQKMAMTQALICFVMSNNKRAIAILQTLNDTNRVKAFCSWGDQFYNGTYGMKRDFDTATLLYQKAKETGDILTAPEWRSRPLAKLAVVSCRRNDIRTGKEYAALAEACYKTPKRERAIGNLWYNMGKAIDTLDHNFPEILACYQKSLSIFHEINSKVDEAWVLMRLADIHDGQGKQDTAEQEYLQAAALLKEQRNPEIHSVYIRMCDLYIFKGDLSKALYYSIEALKSAEAAGVKNLELFYLQLGSTYFLQGQLEKSIEIYNKALASARASDKTIHSSLIRQMSRALVALNRKEEALAFVQSARKEFVSFGQRDQMLIAEALGNCYHALGQDEEAEKYYRKMLELSKSVPLIFSAIYPHDIGKFYFETKQYEKAATYLKAFLLQPGGLVAVPTASATHLMLYKIDSANKNYPSALDHLRQHKQLNDSLFNIAKNKQITELRIQYDIDKKDQDLLLKDQAIQLKQKGIELLTREKLLQQSLAEQKNKDIILKQQNIDLLTQQAALQQVIAEKQEHNLLLKENDLKLKENDLKLQKQNNVLLHNREQLQATQLKQADLIKKITLGGILLLVVIVGLLYNQYRVKQRNNRAISSKNEVLEHLLEEKEWLLKEVHHRVKNNLQIVLSLLESQSAYLQDDALAAIHDSQHRVQAMSLIHQKLYQSDNITTIDMDVYIPELVQYLQESFNIRKRIAFRLDIAPVQLDVAQAIPLGLILNEAITNAIKHAFTGMESGIVRVSLKQLNDDDFVLSIMDNGTGLPAGYENKRKGSLGMSLMKGLSGDFDAQYSIESNGGTHITVAFSKSISHTAYEKAGLTGS
jgi:two-component sensor histidine kinase/tetratricopeptide (TPR) repeat protein